jgi:HD-GYP domain-containing protein (c-di-GMP phosphodiesterase class II)
MFEPHKDIFRIRSGSDTTSLAEILGAFSYALDLTEGQPAGHSMRACWIGMQIADGLGLDSETKREIFYAVLLKDLGCSSNAARVTEMFVGDDRVLKAGFKLIGPDAADFGAFIMTQTGLSAGEVERQRAIAHLLANAGDIMTDLMETRCTRGADIARQLRFGDGTAQAIAHLDEHWDGSGLPLGLSGESIALGGRIALLAQVADVFFMAGNGVLARTEVARRSGTWLDPQLVDLFLNLSKSPDFWSTLGRSDLDKRLFATEPAQCRVLVDEDYLDDIATAFGQVIDAKSPFTGGHSERVSLYADRVAETLGLGEAARRPLRRAAMLHDVGKLGVSSSVLEKPGKLDQAEWAIMQSHAAMTGDILSRIGVMHDMALIAASHHERLDGKGYPLGLDARMIALETRIISVADFFDALTADRPYRAAMSIDDALGVMAAEVGGALDKACFEALQHVLTAGLPQKPLPTLAEPF